MIVRNPNTIDGSPDGMGNFRLPFRIPDGSRRTDPNDLNSPVELPWTRYVIHDPGMANPAAWVWFAVDPDNNIWTYRCHYYERPSSNLEPMCIRALEASRYERIAAWYIDPFDGSKRSRSARGQKTIADLYREAGVDFKFAPRKHDQSGKLQRQAWMARYLDPTNDAPMLWILDLPDMKYVQRELKLYRNEQEKEGDRNRREKAVDAHNHAMYCLETACAMRLKWVPQELFRQLYVPTGEQIVSESNLEYWKELEREKPRGRISL